MGKDKKKKKKIKMIEKVIMGAVIGGAIGSVMGATIAPKKGKETRKEIVDAAKSAKKNSGILLKKLIKIFNKKKKPLKKIPNEMEDGR